MGGRVEGVKLMGEMGGTYGTFIPQYYDKLTASLDSFIG